MSPRASLLASSPSTFGGDIPDFDLVVHEGRLLFVASHDTSRRACTWDPAADLWTEYELDNPFDPYDEYGADYTELTAFGAAVVDGRIIIGGGGDHQGFALWDLESGKVRLPVEPGGVFSTTAADFGGRTLFVVGGSLGAGMCLWDPAVNDPPVDDEDEDDPDAPSCYDFEISIAGLGAHSRAGSAIGAGMLGDRRVVVANDTPMRGVLVRDIDDGHLVVGFDALDESLGFISEFALTSVGGRTRVVAAGGPTLLLGDPGTGGWDDPLTVPGGAVHCLDAASVNGRPIAVTGGEDGTICVWDLAERRLLGRPFNEHPQEVYGVRVTELDGRPVIISAGRHDHVRVWPLVS